MARRIKEEPIIHQNRIAKKAMILFAKKGIENTRMDEIATAAGYGKATLYVYFKNKEDIVSFIALQSMKKLRDALAIAVKNGNSTKETFFSICNELVLFQEEYPAFFERSLQYIQLEHSDDDSWLGQTYQTGEEINQIIIQYIDEGIANGELAQIDDYLETILLMWGMITGIIKLAAEKEEYLKAEINSSKKTFLESGFEKIYKTISM
ncbi:MAG: TetR/AcrR family transcriptional regulator [Lachnospiraceae bacterium]|nr:TetR/AcrR family transcriptional regulator [Lachnospiraceae bacterium]